MPHKTSEDRWMVYALLATLVLIYFYDLFELFSKIFSEDLVRFVTFRIGIILTILIFTIYMLYLWFKKEYNVKLGFTLVTLVLIYELFMFFYPLLVFGNQYRFDFAFFVLRLLLVSYFMVYYFSSFGLAKNTNPTKIRKITKTRNISFTILFIILLSANYLIFKVVFS